MTDDLKSLARAEAERLARVHSTACLVSTFTGEENLCICGRDAEVLAIAAALEEWYRRGIQEEANA